MWGLTLFVEWEENRILHPPRCPLPLCVLNTKRKKRGNVREKRSILWGSSERQSVSCVVEALWIIDRPDIDEDLCSRLCVYKYICGARNNKAAAVRLCVCVSLHTPCMFVYASAGRASLLLPFEWHHCPAVHDRRQGHKQRGHVGNITHTPRSFIYPLCPKGLVTLSSMT